MSKKKHFISTSAVIALILFNAGTVQATNQEVDVKPLLETDQQKTVNTALDTEQLKELFPELSVYELDELELLYSSEKVIELMEQAIMNINQEEFEEALFIFDEINSIIQDDELALEIVQVMISQTDEMIQTTPNDTVGVELVEIAEDEVEEIVTEETATEEVNTEQEAASISLFSMTTQKKSADQYVKDYQNAYYVSDLWTISQDFKIAYPNDSRVDGIINAAATSNLVEGQRVHNRNDFNRAISYYDRVINERRVDDSIQIQAKIYKNLALNAAKIKSVDELYTDYKNAYYVSDKYQITQDFKALFPEDSRLPQMILEVARTNFSEAQYNHNKGNYFNASGYYNRILNEESINGSIRAQIEVLYNSAINNQAIKTADDYYKEYNEAFFVSDLWVIAQEFKLMHPNDIRVIEVINHAIEKNITEGTNAHRKENYNLALFYYNRVANEQLIEKTLQNELMIYTNQAQNGEKLKTANDYFNNYNAAYYVSDLWTISQAFKRDFPNDDRLNEVIDDAAERNMIEARRLHRQKDFDRAIYYYNRVLSEGLVKPDILDEASIYLGQAQKKIPLKTADDYYSDFTKAYYVSDLWSISQSFKRDFPNDTRVIQVINSAAESNIVEGRRVHRQKDFSRALVYYNRVLSESLIYTSLRAELQTYINQASAKRSLKTADDYVTEFNNAYLVSQLWTISQDFKNDFPEDTRVVDLVNNASLKNLSEGQRAHNKKNYSLALFYYNRVLGEDLIHSSLRSEINTYVRQASSNRPLRTPEDYIVDYEKAYYVSDLWSIGQSFKLDFPDDHRLLDVMNHAAMKNLAEGQHAHNRKDYVTAAVYYNRVNSEQMVDASIRNKADAYYYLATNNMNLTNTIIRDSEYNLTLEEMIAIQTNLKGAPPQIWDTINGNPFRDATRAEVAYYVNPANSMPSDLSMIDYLLTTVEVNTNILNVRKGPSTVYGVIGQAFKGERYTILDKDQHSGWYKISYNGTEGWVAGSSAYVKRTSVLQHLRLSGSSGISVADLNKELEGAGILEGHGETFRRASQEANVNELYLIAHALLETGHGSSPLATGIRVNGKMTYNMYGIGAFDNDAHKLGSQRAYELEWFSPETAIIEGAKWISRNYINNPYYKQDTLYKMRWNPDAPGVHQYATDVRWAESQLGTLDSIILLSQKYNTILNFDVPLYQ